jgi:hypothetical protein
MVVLGVSAGPTAAAPPVRAEMTVRWNVQWTFNWNRGYDFDASRVASSSSVMDMWLVFSSYPSPSGMWVFSAVNGNGSRIRAWGGRPSYASCKANRTWDEAAGPLTDPNGTWFCLRTSAGRVARMRVLHWPTKGERFFRFRYLVWQRA